MDVREAVAVAKDYVANLFGPEGARDIGLEEVMYDDDRQTWSVTVGFTRIWDISLTAQIAGHRPGRTYKRVKIIDEDKRVVSVENRDV